MKAEKLKHFNRNIIVLFVVAIVAAAGTAAVGFGIYISLAN